MRKKSIKIIDKTLVTLSELYKDKISTNLSEITELCNILSNMGTDCLEVSQEILYLALPTLVGKNKHLILKNQMDEKEFRDFKLKVYEVNRFTHNKTVERDLHIEIEIEDARNIDSLKDISVLKENVSGFTIRGLDNVMLYDYKETFSKLTEFFRADLNLCPSDKYGLASATALEWLNFGGASISTSFSGAGNLCPLEEFLAARRFILKDSFQGDLTLLPKAVKIVEKISSLNIPKGKPIIGKGIFDFESGIHADGIFKNPETYEPYSPQKIGSERNLIIGKHSGASALRRKLMLLNADYNEEILPAVLDEIRAASTEKERSLSDSEILDICDSVRRRMPWTRY
ncbi:MAG: hypothetical protein ABRQ25_13365 [Clostridiaceae bacterium]